MPMEEYGPTLDATVQQSSIASNREDIKMGLLVDELLNLARVGRQALNRQRSGLNTLVAQVIVMLTSESEWRQAKWVTLICRGGV
jgi:hypothetical protein